jgi:nicotinate phosphoribosyltransferase
METIDARAATGFLMTDQYQLTMAQLYHREGIHETPARFEYFFRSYPDYDSHQAGYCVFAGLGPLLDWMQSTRCRPADVAALRSQTSPSGARVFGDDFLGWLGERGDFGAPGGVTIRGLAEGRVMHAETPVLAVEGPLALCQILETPLLNHLNYPSLIATKAARVRASTRGGTVLEFGMRRGPGAAVNDAARAALIGGADFTSNVGASHWLGLPPRGTHAHSMVQAFLGLGGDELTAFRAFAAAYPDDCLLLVDTVDTLHSGLPHAITVFEELRAQGHEPVGIRLDSGDLAYLAIQAARELNAAGFRDCKIVLSNQLDELVITQILAQIEEEAPDHGVDPEGLLARLVFGVGTSLIVSKGHAALDGVFKLTAITRDGSWEPAIKLSETPAKTLTPGDKGLWRLYDRRGKATADLVGLRGEEPAGCDSLVLHHPSDMPVQRELDCEEIGEVEDLVVDHVDQGQRRTGPEPLERLRARCRDDLARLDPGVRRIVNPHVYHVSLTDALWRQKQDLVARLRGRSDR